MEQFKDFIQKSRNLDKQQTISLNQAISIAKEIDINDLLKENDFNYDFNTTHKGFMGKQTITRTHFTSLFFNLPKKLDLLLKNQNFKDALEQHNKLYNQTKTDIYLHPVNITNDVNNYKIIRVIMDNNTNFDLKHHLHVNNITDMHKLFKETGINYIELLLTAQEQRFNGIASKRDLSSLIPIIKTNITGSTKETILDLIDGEVNQKFSIHQSLDTLKKQIVSFNQMAGDSNIRDIEHSNQTIALHTINIQDVINFGLSKHPEVYSLLRKNNLDDILNQNNSISIEPECNPTIDFKI